MMEKALAMLKNKVYMMNLVLKDVDVDDYEGRLNVLNLNFFKRQEYEARAIARTIEFFTGVYYEISCDYKTWIFSLVEQAE